MANGELAIVIDGRREDWPGGAKTLTPLEAHPGTQRDPLVRSRARPRRRPGLVPDRRGGHRPDAGENARRPRPAPGRRPHRLDHAGPAARARHQPLRGPSLRSRRHVDRTPAVVKMDSLAPAPPAAAALERPTPRRGLHLPEHPPGVLRRSAPARTLGSTAAGSTTRPSPPTSPSSATRAGRRPPPRRRWPRRASGPASPGSRARPGNAPPGCWAATGAPPPPAAAGRRGGSGAADLAAVLATCHRPRRRGRGVESGQVALERPAVEPSVEAVEHPGVCPAGVRADGSLREAARGRRRALELGPRRGGWGRGTQSPQGVARTGLQLTAERSAAGRREPQRDDGDCPATPVDSMSAPNRGQQHRGRTRRPPPPAGVHELSAQGRPRAGPPGVPPPAPSVTRTRGRHVAAPAAVDAFRWRRVAPSHAQARRRTRRARRDGDGILPMRHWSTGCVVRHPPDDLDRGWPPAVRREDERRAVEHRRGEVPSVLRRAASPASTACKQVRRLHRDATAASRRRWSSARPPQSVTTHATSVQPMPA